MKIFCEICGRRTNASAYNNPYMCNCHEFIETFPDGRMGQAADSA